MSSARVLLDTSFLIDYWRGLPEAEALMRRFIDEGSELIVNEVVVCELVTGLRDADLEAAGGLLRPIEFIQPGPESAFEAGHWRARARAQGSELSVSDALIASAAIAAGASVATRNLRDFELTPAVVSPY
ncbi:MAG: PIN domain-containing protein [Chloroflexi bacterium]|nr:PIN domain-containing protein [Chloroflexota bacterium]